VGDALRANEGDEARRKVDELFDVLNRFTPQ
jgi:hypothetical protein